MKILIVDDEYTVVDALREYLCLRGYEVLGAGRGEEALAILPEARPELMLLDIRLPGISGMEVLRKVRALEPSLKVIMITALDDANLRKEALALGAVGFAFKPLDVQGLERIIVTAAGEPPPLAPKSPLKAAQTTVLVVDDEPEICVSLKYYLVGVGYKVLTASNGTEALAQVRASHPTLMLLDLSMPEKGGFTVLEELKRAGSPMPVIILTARDLDTVQQATRLLGARRFLQKPMPLPAIERAIREVLLEGKAVS